MSPLPTGSTVGIIGGGQLGRMLESMNALDPRAGELCEGHQELADWTHEGGYALAIQHSDGYVTVYKHAKQLLKRIGDRVRNRETVALSGNSGEFTTGPHLHVEIWHNGLAQDPRYFFVGL